MNGLRHSNRNKLGTNLDDIICTAVGGTGGQVFMTVEFSFVC